MLRLSPVDIHVNSIRNRPSCCQGHPSPAEVRDFYQDEAALQGVTVVGHSFLILPPTPSLRRWLLRVGSGLFPAKIHGMAHDTYQLYLKATVMQHMLTGIGSSLDFQGIGGHPKSVNRHA